MTDPRTATTTPTQVALYTNATDPRRRIAVFRWSEAQGVTVELLDAEWERIPRQYYERGVELLGERRMVLPSEGPLFMRALLQPFRRSYYTLVDESGQ
jgi:hypothetical protein